MRSSGTRAARNGVIPKSTTIEPKKYAAIPTASNPMPAGPSTRASSGTVAKVTRYCPYFPKTTAPKSRASRRARGSVVLLRGSLDTAPCQWRG
ncbi:Uncharacterised protein [Mycobacteroides abscessus subsp. abscessus]|nr:Uncharacterised protein [Mycobacteroides abscessus subsp. abscessus]